MDVSRDLDPDFVGVKRTVTGPQTIEYTCLGIIESLHELVKPYPMMAGWTDEWPMGPNATRELRMPPDDDNPLVPLLVPIARRIAGTIGFVATKARPDSYFGFCVMAKYVNERRLTRRGFLHLLRLAWYLVRTKDLPLVIHAASARPDGQAWGTEGMFRAYVDSSHGNAEDGQSYGGFIIMHNGGGAIAWKCLAQDFIADSPSAQELAMATTCYKYIMALRMMLYELRVGPPGAVDPTPIYTDSQVLLDGAASERLSKSSRWLAARYAMMRRGRESRQIAPLKVAAEDNVADIVTKPLTGALFIKHREAILGLSMRKSGI